MPSRPRRSGASTTICRSKRPGRSSAGSSTSGRFVAAMRMTPSFDSKPSISTSSWLSVCSRSSWPPPRPAPRCRPTASISSMKMMHGACALPCSNRSRTRLAPTPTNISTKSEPDIEKNGRPASPATARASSVLPVPGGPTSSAPFGSRPPSFVNFCGSFRNSMISWSSTLASSAPATSANVTFGVSPVSSFAFDLPNENAFAPPACICRKMKIQNADDQEVRQERSRASRGSRVRASCASIVTFASRSRSTSFSESAIGQADVEARHRPPCSTTTLSRNSPVICFPAWMVTFSMLSARELRVVLASRRSSGAGSRARAGELDERDGDEDDENPERERLRALAPSSSSPFGGCSLRQSAIYCKLAMYGKWRKFSA